MTTNDTALDIPCLQSPDPPSALLWHDPPLPASPVQAASGRGWYELRVWEEAGGESI